MWFIHSKERHAGCSFVLADKDLMVPRINFLTPHKSRIISFHSPDLTVRKPLTFNQCIKASNQRLLVRLGFPKPKPWPPFW